MVGAKEQKLAVEYVQKAHKVSERRACSVLNAPRTVIRYRPVDKGDESIKASIKEVVEKRPRFGAPRVHQMLRRRGIKINHKRTERLYKELGLSLKKKKRKKYKSELRIEPDVPIAKNEVWAMDFVHDALAAGKKIRGLTIIDICTKECPAIEVDFSLSSFKVITVLERLKENGGIPKFIKVDNGPEFISLALDKWASDNNVGLYFSRRGKPTDNANIESFNGKFRDECLNVQWFTTLEMAKRICEEWRKDYNEERPHSSLAYKTPKEFAEELKFMVAS